MVNLPSLAVADTTLLVYHKSFRASISAEVPNAQRAFTLS